MAEIVVPFDGSPASAHMLDMACRTARETGGALRAVYVVRIPAQLPISADIPSEQARADTLWERARAIADACASDVTLMVVRARAVGPGIVAAAQGCDLLMVGVPVRRTLLHRLWPRPTLRYVAAHASCEVLVGYVDASSRGGPVDHLLLAPATVSSSTPDNVLPLAQYARATVARESGGLSHAARLDGAYPGA